MEEYYQMDKRTRNYILVVAALFILLLLLRFTGVADYDAINQQNTAAIETAAQSGNTAAKEDAADSGSAAEAAEESSPSGENAEESSPPKEASYTFRTPELRLSHFTKHGIDMGFTTEEAYEEAASRVITNPRALHKTEAEDGDDVYYVEDTNEFVILSTDGYIRTYFNPDRGKAYFDRQ